MTRDQLQGRTRKVLADMARKRGIAGWNTMVKDELVKALAHKASPPRMLKAAHAKRKDRIKHQAAAARDTSQNASAEEQVERSKYDVGVPTRDLSAKILDGTVDLNRSSRLSDDELIAALASVRGIGRWTAEMYLMFELRRLDVWPVGDLGVRQGYGVAWGLQPMPSAKQLDPLGDRFRPYRSIVARYCWAAVALFRGGTDPALR